MKHLCIYPLLLAAFILISCGSNPHSEKQAVFNEIIKKNNEYNSKLQLLKDQQDTTTNVDLMFELDAKMKALKDSANKDLATTLEGRKLHLPFSQLENADKILIDSLYVSEVKLNEFNIEAKVTALQSSAFDMVYTSLSAIDTTGNKLDVAGGIGADSKLEAGHEYTFKGTIKNTYNISENTTILFDEFIKKW